MSQTAAQSALFIAARLGRIWGDIPPNDMARLLFLAQSWHLLSNGEPLFKDVIYAGFQGPVIKGLGHLPDVPRFPAELIDLPGRAFLDGFCHTYAAADAESVCQQVNRADGAWALTRKVSGDLTPIPGGADIQYVLEINAGMAKRLGIAKGAQMRHPAIAAEKAAWPCD